MHGLLLESSAYRRSTTRAPQLLAALGGDVCAVVLSYTTGAAHLTLATASPRMRLYAEAMLPSYSKHNPKLCMSGAGLALEVYCSDYRFAPLQPVDTIAWWLTRCHVPLTAQSTAALKEIAAASDAVRDLLRSVHLSKGDAEVGVPGAVLRGVHEIYAAGAHLLVRWTDPRQLTSVRRVRFYRAAAADVLFLREVPHITELYFGGLLATQLEMSRFATAVHLETLAVHGEQLRAIRELHACMSLVLLDVSYCPSVTTLAPVLEAPWVRAVIARRTGVRNVGGFSKLILLESLDLTQCRRLSSVAGVAGARRLRHLNLRGSAVSDIAGLDTCTALQTVDVGGCTALRSLAPLGGAPSLRFICADKSGVEDIAGLHRCGSLEAVSFSLCHGLHSLSALAGAPRLRTILMRSTPLSDLERLHTCPALECVDFCCSPMLQRLSALNGAPCLRHIVVAESGVRGMEGLERCAALRSVDLGRGRVWQRGGATDGAWRLRAEGPAELSSTCVLPRVGDTLTMEDASASAAAALHGWDGAAFLSASSARAAGS